MAWLDSTILVVKLMWQLKCSLPCFTLNNGHLKHSLNGWTHIHLAFSHITMHFFTPMTYGYETNATYSIITLKIYFITYAPLPLAGLGLVAFFPSLVLGYGLSYLLTLLHSLEDALEDQSSHLLHISLAELHVAESHFSEAFLHYEAALKYVFFLLTRDD